MGTPQEDGVVAEPAKEAAPATETPPAPAPEAAPVAAPETKTEEAPPANA